VEPGATSRRPCATCSSFQLETVEAFRPAVAAILNLSPDHLDRYRSLDAYAADNAGIF
jgi:UDP-N-acetylmuramoylalanine--D-glutamate ligase